jgi:hypothetical protein
MPGAPNRPPETGEPAPAPAVPEDVHSRKIVRRLAPDRIVLSLELWKGAPGVDLIAPYDKAETLYLAGDLAGADSALDLLSVRLAEPRWPSLPAPWRDLRVSIPAPQPPQWDPEFSLSPAEKETKKLRREADKNLALLTAALDWLGKRSIAVDDLRPEIVQAQEALAGQGPAEPFWAIVDRTWTTIRERTPSPPRAAPRAPPPPQPASVESVEEA